MARGRICQEGRLPARHLFSRHQAAPPTPLNFLTRRHAEKRQITDRFLACLLKDNSTRRARQVLH